jgi:serine phosphatase RsbU (regulator of sigma subunit)
MLHPLVLPGQPPAAVETVDGSLPGRAFSLHTIVEHAEADGSRRLWVPLLDGTDRVGVMALTLAPVDDDVRAHVRRLAGTIAHLFLSKGMCTDDYFRIRRRRDLTLAAEMQWSLLPPLAIATPQVSVAGLLEPAYRIAGDSFDYALNAEALHFAIFDAMGHGLTSAIMATTCISAYRHARRMRVPLAEMYDVIDKVMGSEFGEDSFATAQLSTLDVNSGLLAWVNAGHPAPLLVRGGKAVRFLHSTPTTPAGVGGAAPAVATEQLEPGDRLLLFSDGVVEHRNAAGEMFGEERLAERLVRHISEWLPTPEVLRRLNRDLLNIVGPEGPHDDATLVLVHWTGTR